MVLLLALHAVVGFTVIGVGERLGRRALWAAAVPIGATLAWLVARAPTILDGGVVTESVAWVPGLGLDIDLRLDGFGALFVLLVSGIGMLVLAYAGSYFPPVQSGLGRLVGLLTLFAGAMFGLVVADNLLVLYGFWELTSVASYFLIGNRSDSATARAAALQALLTTGLGALAMLVGFVLIGQAAGTFRLSAVLAHPPGGTTVAVALALVLLGAVTKSAQYPFHSWLPGAMVAPTPVSAYLHSATMVKAGVYLVARFTPAFADVALWRPAVVAIGATTMVLGGLRAMRQHDLKLLLAHGTISQLGFMFVLFGIGTPAAATAGCVVVLAHAAFKATLFMGVGILDRSTGTRDLRELPYIGGAWPGVAVVVLVGAASMAGVPPLLGFVAKEAGLAALVDAPATGATVVLAVVVAASALTVAYSARLAVGGLWADGTGAALSDDQRPAGLFVAPPLVLAAITVVFGLAPSLLDGGIGAATAALGAGAADVHLALWHGFNAALGLSAIALVGGTALFLARRRVAGVLALGAAVPSGAAAYRWVLRAVNRLADRVTGVVQHGSLPAYAGVILATCTVVPGIALAASFDPDWFGAGPGTSGAVVVGTALIGAILLAAAIRAAGIHRRYAAALLLAGVGYGMAGLFVIQGAPDLALTTVAVESLFTVLFVLVLRSLPDRFEQRRTWFGQAFRLAVAGLVGGVVFVFALAAASDRSPATTSEEMIQRSLPDGHGRNVVNVILVDFRGFDTVGELTVLAAASIGAVALARAVRRPGRPPGEQDEPDADVGESGRDSHSASGHDSAGAVS